MLDRTTRFTFSAAARSSSTVGPSIPVRSIALTSMWPASQGASSSGKPVRMFTVPSGKSEVASASASSTAATGMRRGCDRHDRVSPDQCREQSGDETEKWRLRRGEDRDDARRLGNREVEVRPGYGVRAAEHLGELVCPSRVPDRAVDRRLDLVATLASALQIRGARLHHLGEAVEDLPAVVRGHAGPGRERGAGGPHCVAGVLARGACDVVPLGFEGPPRLRAGERAAEVQLVRLLDGESAHRANAVGR